MRRICAISFGFLLSVTALAQAQELLSSRGLASEEIARIARGLGSEQAEQRARSARALRDLHAESLPGIEARLAELRGRSPAPEEVRAALTAFRHAVGSRRADDDVDIAPGVLPVLAERRDDELLAVAERLLLLRSLEAMGTPRAGRALGGLAAVDEGVWKRELDRVQKRMGITLLPALIALRSHPEPAVKRWAQRAVHELGMGEPARALELDDAQLLSAVLRAYADPLDFPAMPHIVRLVGSDEQLVRDAARGAVARFGKNAIWQLRELYQELTSQPADKDWDHERTAREVYAVLDRRVAEEAETRLAKGMSRFVAGDIEGMAAHYDRLLSRFPDFPRREQMAPGYAALGEHHLHNDRLDAARDAYQRALRLGPETAEAPRWRAQLAYVDAERAIRHGVVDLTGYSRALAIDPSHTAAAQAHDVLSGSKAARERTLRRAAGAAAAALLIAFLVLLMRRPQAPAP